MLWFSTSDQPIVTQHVAIQASILLHGERRFARGDEANRFSHRSSLECVQAGWPSFKGVAGQTSSFASLSHPICVFHTLFHAVIASFSVLTLVTMWGMNWGGKHYVFVPFTSFMKFWQGSHPLVSCWSQPLPGRIGVQRAPSSCS